VSYRQLGLGVVHAFHRGGLLTGKTRYFRRCLEGDADRYIAEGWTDPTAVFVPSLEEAVIVLERPCLCPDLSTGCELCRPKPEAE
jgi:hypothetical protein